MSKTHNPIRIAMWSGPRNLSTAMLRSFASRGDCAVVDEPFYAAYLAASGADHPMREEVLASQSQDPNVIAKQCLERPVEQPIEYQKHMTQHLLPDFDRSFINQLTNVFLIREPERVVASFTDRMGDFVADEIGFRQQAEIFDQVAIELGEPPPVVEASDILADPEAALKKLCQRLGISFKPSMLSWEPGMHPGYGVWAQHWYRSMLESTGFGTPAKRSYPPLAGQAADIAAAAREYYDRLAIHRL